MKEIIRPARESELDDIVALWKEMLEFHRERDRYFTPSDDAPASFRKWALENLLSEDFLLLVAEVDKELVGYCLAGVSMYPPLYELEEYGVIYDLAVTRRHRRKGLGEKLFRGACRWFTRKGLQRLEIGVAVSNEIAGPFWRKMGFTPFMEKLYLEKW